MSHNMMHWVYGGFAIRHYDTNHGYWTCIDSDYHWKSVVDDFGNLVRVGPYISMTEVINHGISR